MEHMTIVVQRQKKNGQLVTGSLTVNGQLVGTTYENTTLMIPAGLYPGGLRYVSGHNFVQGPFGTIADHGDFLLEIGNVPGRTSILFHGGNKPKHSRGCILLGAVAKDSKTHKPLLEYDHPLRKLRRLFYGTETPEASPDKTVTIRVSDINFCYPYTDWSDSEFSLASNVARLPHITDVVLSERGTTDLQLPLLGLRTKREPRGVRPACYSLSLTVLSLRDDLRQKVHHLRFVARDLVVGGA